MYNKTHWAEILEFQPDLLVGSSWGGAVALNCIERGTWCGPALLLAPALTVSGIIMTIIALILMMMMMLMMVMMVMIHV